MTDLEITKLCAEAMGYTLDRYETGWRIWVNGELTYNLPDDGEEHGLLNWEPLHDDAQAMALVKQFELYIVRDGEPEEWVVTGDAPEWSTFGTVSGYSQDLNRAICECVAQMTGKSHA